jgi:hypothetical protein
MHQFQIILATLVLFLSATFVFAQSDVLIWNGSSEELEKYIKSKDENKKVFALQKIIMNPENINTNYFAHDIYRMYRSHKNEKLRQMALVTLYKMKHYNLLKNLRNDLYTEKNLQIRKQIYSILEKMPVLSELN